MLSVYTPKRYKICKVKTDITEKKNKKTYANYKWRLQHAFLNNRQRSWTENQK